MAPPTITTSGRRAGRSRAQRTAAAAGVRDGERVMIGGQTPATIISTDTGGWQITLGQPGDQVVRYIDAGTVARLDPEALGVELERMIRQHADPWRRLGSGITAPRRYGRAQ